MARHRHKTPLGWFLVVSLLVNHAVVWPVAYYLLNQADPVPPETVEVELVDPPSPPPELDPPRPSSPPRRTRAKPSRIPRRVALLKKPKKKKKPLPEPQQPKKKPPEKKKEPPRVPPPPPEAMRLKMVEVQNPETRKPPPNARFLSDKNRQVKKETRARHTNLIKDSPRPRPMSFPERKRQPKPGSKKPRIAETKRQRAKKVHPLLAMRPRPSRRAQDEVERLAPDGKQGTLQRPQKSQRGRRLRLHLDHKSHDRIYGKEALRQRELARLAPSKSRTGHSSKWKRIKSALENFIPEVRPGNQTALGTRANPFALYIARMHRRIHRLWGFGFLVDLDLKSDSHPMNDMKLWSMIEVAIAPDGKVEKATIVKHSGLLAYDVAALDTIFTGGPYPPTPRNIRSSDGKVYLHWRFHRNQRQCGTFGVDPYILNKPPRGPIDGDLSEVGKPGGKGQRRLGRLNRARTGSLATGTAKRRAAPSGKATARRSQQQRTAREAARRLVDPSDPGALRAAMALVRGFEKADTQAMVKACGLPFLSRGRKVATSRKDLARMFRDLLAESKGKQARDLELMTVMTARTKLGRLPPGAAHGEQMLVGRVQLGGVQVTLILQRRSGDWQVVGLNRGN